MTQTLEWTAWSGLTLTLRLIALDDSGSPVTNVYEAASGITGKTGHPRRYRETRIPDAVTGLHHVSVVDGSGNNVYEGYCDMAGVAGSFQVANQELHTLILMQDRPAKNRAWSNFKFVMFASSDGKTPIASESVTGVRFLDGETTGTALEGSVTEIGNGVYSYNFTAADLNGDVVLVKFSSTNAEDHYFFWPLRPAA